MSSNTVQFVEGAVTQRPADSIAYTVNTALYGGSPTSPAVTIHDITTGADAAGTNVSDTKLRSGESPSVSGDVITTPHVEGIEGGRRYRLTVQFTCAGQTYAPFVYVQGAF